MLMGNFPCDSVGPECRFDSSGMQLCQSSTSRAARQVTLS